MDKPSCDLAVALRIITMQSFYGATVAGLTAVGSGFGTTAGADRRRDVSISSTIQIILYMWDDHVSFGNKNPASGYKLQIFDKGQIMKGSSGNITAVNLHGIEDADRSNLSESGRCPFNFTQESFVGIILKLIGEAVLIVVSGFSAAFGVAETVKNHDNAIDRKM